MGLGSQRELQRRDLCVHPSFPVLQDPRLPRAAQGMRMRRARSGIAALVLGVACEKFEARIILSRTRYLHAKQRMLVC